MAREIPDLYGTKFPHRSARGDELTVHKAVEITTDVEMTVPGRALLLFAHDQGVVIGAVATCSDHRYDDGLYSAFGLPVDVTVDIDDLSRLGRFSRLFGVRPVRLLQLLLVHAPPRIATPPSRKRRRGRYGSPRVQQRAAAKGSD